MAIDDEPRLDGAPAREPDGRDRKALLAALKTLADEEDVVRFVVGLPLT